MDQGQLSGCDSIGVYAFRGNLRFWCGNGICCRRHHCAGNEGGGIFFPFCRSYFRYILHPWANHPTFCYADCLRKYHGYFRFQAVYWFGTPGYFDGGRFGVYVLFYGKKNDLPAHPRQSVKQIAITFKDGIWALLMPVIILGGIFGGIFTPTESAAVAVAYALLISFLVYKDMSFRDLYGVLIDSCIGTATIMVLVGISKASSYVVTTSGLPHQVLALFSSVTESKVIVLLLLNLLFLVIGMLMEANAAIIMMTPILLPLLNAFGIDTLQFGIIMSFNLCLGLVTPPVGICLLMTNQIADASFVKTLKAVMPMLLIGVIVLLLVTYIPQVTTFLPAFIQ